jgi:outer membrane autotransporter protein
MANHLLATLKEISPPPVLGYPKNFHLKLSIVAIGLGAMAQVQAQSPIAGLLTSQPGLDTTQTNMAEVIEVACPNGTNEAEFQARCNGVVSAAGGAPSSSTNALQVVSPEQMPSQGIGATRTSISTIGGRLAALRAGARGFQVAGLTNGQPLTNLAALSPYNATGGSAGEAGSEIWERLGVFVNGNYNTGDVDSAFNQLGYNFNSGSVTAGLDYRFTKDLILGTAFTYTRTESGFDRNGGSLDSNAYTGAFYGTFYATESLYFDGIATFGGINYDSIRNIQYAVPTDVVNTKAKANPDGEQYSVSLGGGYNFALQEWTLNPYARVNYIKLDVDKFSEQGGDGWAMRFSDQTVESVTTTLGSQVSYSLSTPWGVFLPNLRGEWHHQYKDNSRTIAVAFLGDTTSGLVFDTVTDDPDRNYFTVGTGVSGTFAKGVTAFLNYDTLLGYRNIDSHLFTVGARLEF